MAIKGHDTSRCRICGSEIIVKRGQIEFYFGYAWPVYDCDDCGCRFTHHDGSTYDLLYSEKRSSYNAYYADLGRVCKSLFDRGDIEGLRAKLSNNSKYQFIIEWVDRAPVDARILEIGCSLGHLASYFILTGRNIVGMDLSPKAIATATAAFGDHFVQSEDPSIKVNAPYDVVFHVGTIGCVSDPLGMTGKFLDLLKSGGSLLFNAPNRDARTTEDQLWFKSAPPPDVVTLFTPGFWHDHFGGDAVVSEEVEFRELRESFSIALRRRFGRKWQKPMAVSLTESGGPCQPPPSPANAYWRILELGACKTALWTGQLHRARPHPSEYGLFVRMIKR